MLDSSLGTSNKKGFLANIWRFLLVEAWPPSEHSSPQLIRKDKRLLLTANCILAVWQWIHSMTLKCNCKVGWLPFFMSSCYLLFTRICLIFWVMICVAFLRVCIFNCYATVIWTSAKQSKLSITCTMNG